MPDQFYAIWKFFDRLAARLSCWFVGHYWQYEECDLKEFHSDGREHVVTMSPEVYDVCGVCFARRLKPKQPESKEAACQEKNARLQMQVTQQQRDERKRRDRIYKTFRFR